MAFGRWIELLGVGLKEKMGRGFKIKGRGPGQVTAREGAVIRKILGREQGKFGMKLNNK